jgi:hypothetical protein
MFRMLLVTVLLSACLLMTGCFQSESGKATVTPAADSASSNAKPVQPVKNETEKPKAEAPPKTIEWGANVLRNPLFGEWTEDTPADWTFLEKLDTKWTAVKPQKVDDQDAIALPAPGEGEFVQMMQVVPADSVRVGAPIKFGAKVKASQAGQVQVVLSYRVKNQEKKHRTVSQESDDWQNLQYEGSLPKDAAPETVRFFIFRHTTAPGDVLIEAPYLSFGK